jgi:hypothetical protein
MLIKEECSLRGFFFFGKFAYWLQDCCCLGMPTRLHCPSLPQLVAYVSAFDVPRGPLFLRGAISVGGSCLAGHK